jgi:PTH1 family peptidyl-tRNA hydrolase
MKGFRHRVIVGLGNPGRRYERNRHNVGFMVVDALAAARHGSAWSMEGSSQTCRLDLEGESVIAVKPLTYMNRSGEAVRHLRVRYGFEPPDFLVVLDDLSLPLGRLRIRERGSAGGHHGLESLLQALESNEILRLRLGIGEEEMPPEKADFVLSDFPADKQETVDEMIARACAAVQTILRDGVARAMAVYNA